MIRRILCFFDKVFFKIFTFHINNSILDSIKGGCYCTSDKQCKKSRWKNFKRESYFKKIYVLGLDGAGVLFADRVPAQKIYGIYLLDNPTGITFFRGIPVNDISKLRTMSYANAVYVIASTTKIKDYAEVLHNLQIDHYYSFINMETRRFHIRIRRGLIRWRYLVIPRLFKREGYIANYVLFPIAAFFRKHKIRPFYKKEYGELRNLKDIHKGERCFILATGPSLRIEDAEALKDEYTFGVNGIFKLYDKTDWRPTYYALCDPFVYPDYLKNGYDMNIDSFSKKGAFFSYKMRKLLKKNPNAKSVKQIPFCMLDHALTFNSDSLKYSLDPLWGFYNLRTVVGFCINLADYMGFKDIYILGVDCDYVTHGQHFDSEKSPNLLQYEQLVMAQKFMLGAFQFIKEQTQNRNINIYNCTRGGALNVFPRIELEQLLGIEKIQHSIPLPKAAIDAESDNIEIETVFSEDEEIMVSVVILTYNHEPYIRQALNSVLKQKTTFRYEIVIGDDASQDNTASIIREYAEKFPSIFNIIIRDKNVGGSQNAYDLFMRARGKYIANLEGDDYWTDLYKLQHQVDFLENNENYIGCVHQCRWVDADGEPIPEIAINNNLPSSGDYTLDNLRDGMWQLPGQTGTLFYRNIYTNNIERTQKTILLDKAQCDRSIVMLLLSYGNIYCDKAVMSDYRYNINSATSHASNFTRNIMRKYNMILYFKKLEDISEDLFGERLSFFERRTAIFRQAIKDLEAVIYAA